jgi:predicted histone-like DNA-binding protein
MTVKFNIVERGNPSNRAAPKKFYPSLKSTGRVNQRKLVETAARETALSTGDMMNALETILKIIPRELAEGNIVELGDFGSFWLRLETEGADTADQVTPSSVTGALARFTPGKLFKQTLEVIQFSKIEGSEPESEPT